MNAYRLLVLPLVLAAIAGPRPAQAQATRVDPVATLIAQSRTALGGAVLDRIKTLTIAGKITVGGIAGTGNQWSEIGGSRFAESYDIAPLSGGDGYDGRDVWNRDGSGLVWVDGGKSGRAQEICQAYVADYALWTPNRGGAKVAWGGPKTDGGRTYDVLTITPPQAAIGFDMWLDRTTHLPARYVQTIGPVVATTTYSDYRAVSGLMVSYVSHSQSSDGNSSDASITQAVADAPDALAHLAKPSSNVHDFSIAGGAGQTSVPFNLVENHVYLSVMLNGKGPYRFIYDTGGANIVDPAVAQEIGASGHGSIQGGGVGEATESVSFANVETMKIGDATITNQVFGVAPTRMGFGMSGGRPVDGLIGFEVLSRFITTFDYANNTVVLSMPASAPASPGAGIVPFVLDGRQPQFACGIDGIAAQCTVDTGARDSITLMGPFVTAHPQIVPPTLTAIGVNGFGFGGPSMGKLGRIKSVTFGTYAVPNVVGDFSTQQKGAFAVPFIAANVGGNIWRRFTLTLDYYKQTMALTPNAAYKQPDVYERAGLFLLNRSGKYVVLDSRPGTAAAAAGILKGDTIDSIDGKPVSGMSLQEVRDLFYGAPGTVIRIGLIGKDGTARTATLTLHDFI